MPIRTILSKSLKFTFSSWVPWALAIVIVLIGVFSDAVRLGAAQMLLSSGYFSQKSIIQNVKSNGKTDNVLPAQIQSLFDGLGVSDAASDANKAGDALPAQIQSLFDGIGVSRSDAEAYRANTLSIWGITILFIIVGLIVGYISLVSEIGINYAAFENEKGLKVGLMQTLKFSFRKSWRFIVLLILGAILAFVCSLPIGIIKGIIPSLTGFIDSIWTVAFTVLAMPALMIANALVIVSDLSPGKAFRQGFKLAYTRIFETMIIFLPILIIEALIGALGQSSFIGNIPWWSIALVTLPWIILIRAYVIKAVKELVELDLAKPKQVVKFV